MKVVFLINDSKELNPFTKDMDAEEIVVLLQSAYLHIPTSSESVRSSAYVKISKSIFHVESNGPQWLEIMTEEVSKESSSSFFI